MAAAFSAAVAPSLSLLPSSLAFSSASSSPSPFGAKQISGLPTLRKLQVSCSSKNIEQQDDARNKGVEFARVSASGVVASALMAASHPAMALVDERLSTEGTGLSLGLSNPLLIWILLGVATLIWTLYFTYSSSLPEGDDDSGLSL